MLANIGLLGYLASSTGFLILALLLIISWRGRIEGGVLLVAVVVQALWSGLLAYHAQENILSPNIILTSETVRFFFWNYFLLQLLSSGERNVAFYLKIVIYVLTVLVAIQVIPWSGTADIVILQILPKAPLLILLVYSIIGVVLIEQLYRNVQPDKRWAIKFLCIGLVVLFTYDLYLYANALLFEQIDKTLWDARGLVNALAIPLIAISARRNNEWSFDIFVSRHVVFYSTSIMAVGVYLTFMSLGGYYIRIYGGEWGDVAQVIFFVGSITILFVVLVSGKTRALLKVFLTKHFYKNKYDYREEWLRLIHNISEYQSARYFNAHIIQTVAGILQSRGGLLFLEQDDRFRCVSTWNSPVPEQELSIDSSLIRFLYKYEWIIDINEFRSDKEKYTKLELPDWMLGIQSAWLIIPLKHNYKVIGFLLLLESGINKVVNWEDRDLLKAVGRQISSYLAFIQASEALSQAEQFDAFNRLSAYVVHDLKNQVSQLELVVKNAESFRDNPEFISDAFMTVGNVVSKMQKMLGQLRKMRLVRSDMQRIDTGQVVQDVVSKRSIQTPAPVIRHCMPGLKVLVEPDRFENALEHLVQNAQEATGADGHVWVDHNEENGHVLIIVEDDGEGMTKEFIRERLFRPFDTTKGNAGMGIGVYEVKELVTSLNGSVEVESTPGVGTIFRIKLPLEDGG